MIFGSDLVVCSDKSIAYDEGIDPALAWSRWFRRSIQHGLAQVDGAVRWLRDFPDRVYRDSQCSEKLDAIPSTGQTFHRIVIANGIRATCQKVHRLEEPGGLRVDTKLRTIEEMDKTPLTVGLLPSSTGFVHVFDETALQLVLSELDTARDFIDYLKRRESFLTSKSRIRYASEEQLLAIYLTTVNEDGEHDFVLPENVRPYDSITFSSDFWPELRESKEYASRRNANKVSYFWDAMLERFLKNSQAFSNRPSADISLEKINLFYLLASTSRFHRRMLCEGWLALCQSDSDRPIRTAVNYSANYPECAFLFVCLYNLEQNLALQDADYRARYFGQWAYAIKVQFPRSARVAAVIQSMDPAFPFEDMFVYQTEPWTDEDQVHACKLRDQLGIHLGSGTVINSRAHEYPE